MSGIVTGVPRVLLRLEGLSILVAASAAYAWHDGSGWLFAALFLAPDLSMLGYLAGRKAGAALYNLGHWYVAPLACIAWGVCGQASQALAVGLIWAAHIGFDRAFGYGLKYAEGFNVSHLGSLGRARDAATAAARPHTHEPIEAGPRMSTIACAPGHLRHGIGGLSPAGCEKVRPAPAP